ncbi:phage fiber-tail adaptor protein [Zavarzinella formosa]|uniref:phage fiber-tail adaptor protein n=1 Tax=Zavarzinella formosa TaxID=360055 RepID=UPI0002EE4632|nr:hypothetical protein [Zavarzinella formosa]
MSASFNKDPSARKDYQVDWAAWLVSDTISAVVWTVPAGLTNYATSNTTTSATIWLSGGTHGTNYLVTCQITTAGGRIEQQSFTIQCRDQ